MDEDSQANLENAIADLVRSITKGGTVNVSVSVSFYPETGEKREEEDAAAAAG